MKKTVLRRSAVLFLVIFTAVCLTVPVSARKSGGILTIDGYKEREIVSYTYTFECETDEEDQLTGIPRGGTITIEVKALKDGSSDLLKWMLSKNLTKNGKIEILDPASNKSLKTISFEDAYCVGFEEGRTEDGDHTEIITLSCRAFTNGDVKFENDWDSLTGSMVSEGNIAMIIAGVSVIAAAAAALIIVNNKKKASGTENADK